MAEQSSRSTIRTTVDATAATDQDDDVADCGPILIGKLEVIRSFLLNFNEVRVNEDSFSVTF